MDLSAARGGARWDALTSLIDVGIVEEPDEIYLLPMWVAPTGTYSRLMHELCHQWCARRTRLGWLLGREGGDLWTAYEDSGGQPVRVSQRLTTLLGALTPVLEGVAMYAQLDYEAEEDGEPFLSPLIKAVELLRTSRLSFDRSIRSTFRLERENVLSEGLLENLFLTTTDATTQHYFVGYLYVKALEAYVKGRSRIVRSPEWLLPLLIKLLFDSRTIVACYRDNASAADYVDAVHRRFLSLSEEDWATIDSFLSRDDRWEWFDAWDLEAQLEIGVTETPIEHSADEVMTIFAGQTEAAATASSWLRSHTGIHLLDWAEGVLSKAGGGSLDGEDLDVQLRTDNGRTVRVRIGPVSNLWVAAMKAQISGEKDLDRRKTLETAASLAVGSEQAFHVKLHALQGKRVTVGLYFAVHNLSLGAVLWGPDGAASVWFFSPEPFLNGTAGISDAEVVLSALHVPPQRRVEFARSAVGVRFAVHQASKATGQLLASNPRHQDELGQRLLGPSFTRWYSQIADWCRWRLDRYPLPTALDNDVVIFDLPGFPPGVIQGVNNLLPPLPMFDEAH